MTEPARTHKVSITSVGPTSHCVIVDGVDLSHGLTGLSLTMGIAGTVPQLTLDVMLIDVTTLQDVEAQVILGPGCHDALVSLGWTPPEGQEQPSA